MRVSAHLMGIGKYHKGGSRGAVNKTIQVVILGVLLSGVLRVLLRVILGMVLGMIIGVVLGMVLRKVIRKVLGVVQWLVWGLVLWMLGKPQHKNIAVHLGIAQIAPPHSNGHSVAPIFGQNHANARLYLDISPKNRCHKPSWQGFRPPPKRATPK